MNVKSRILAIRLANKIEENTKYAEKIGISIVNNYEKRKINKFQEVNIMDCANCEMPLDGGVYTPKWADGDNSYSYVTCPHCGYEHILDDDDD